MIAVVVAVSLVLEPPVEGGDAPAPDVGPIEDATIEDAAVEPTPEPDAPPPRPAPVPDDRSVEPHPSVIGNYWDMDRTRPPEPDDGQEELIAGSILVPLGLIATSSAAATIWLSAPGHCQARWKALDATPTDQQCKGLRTFGIVRVSYGSLMVITGAVLLGIGLTRREKHRKWERGLAVSPWFGPRGGGLSWGGRFGFRRG